jgi:hypothetical protein
MTLWTAYWWIRHIVFLCAGIFFLLFGVILLISAYRTDNPAQFIMTFFASNLMILISGTIVVGLIVRLIASKKEEDTEERTPRHNTE